MLIEPRSPACLLLVAASRSSDKKNSRGFEYGGSPALYLSYGRFLLTRAKHGTAVVVEPRARQEAIR